MQYTAVYQSPLGNILLAEEEAGLSGLWFEGQKYFARGLDEERTEKETPILAEVRRWLDVYFSGREPDFTPALRPRGTPFQTEVWALLREIPYGETTTYGALAKKLAAKRCGNTSARAVGAAVGRNPISILIPCHRVVGSDGGLTGYAGGLERKIVLLKGERSDYFAIL